MEHRRRTVAGAFVAGFAMVAFAIYSAATSPSQPTQEAPALAVVSDPSVLRQAIPERDQNDNGTPDWQEALSNIAVPALPNATNTDFTR